MKKLALATVIALTVWAQQPMPPMPGAPEYPQGDPRSPQSNQAPPAYQNGPGQNGPDLGPDDDQADAPDRGVARISYMTGNVSVRRGDSGELTEAIVNAPLTIGDRIVTGDGRAEVQFDSANLIRLGPGTEVRMSELQYHRYQIQIAAGSASFRVLRDSDAQVELSTPSISIHPARRGMYRVNVRPDGTTEITLRGGAEGEVFGPRGSEQIRNGSTMLVRGSSSDPEFQVVGAAGEDEFDRWCGSRDSQFERAASPRYVPRDVYGAEDLDGNGRWVNDPSYGQVWQPTGVDPGWAPYQCGRWVWIDYYGWSWVGCESWGWAPYHYGRWFYGSAGWCWWPGGLYSRYYWRPALVGFFGWGGGHVGWVPLAPHERFHAWYGRGGYRGFNTAYINVNSAYRNARYSGGVTSIRSGDFGRGFVNRSNIVRASSADLNRAGAMRGSLPFSPTRESRSFGNRSVSTQGMPRTSDNTRFFSRSQAPSGGRNFSTPSSPASTQRAPATQDRGGWQRFDQGTRNQGQGSRAPVSPNTTSPAQGSQGGWRRYEGGNRQVPQSRVPEQRGGFTPAPRNESPRYGSPRYESPRYESPRNDAPRYQAPPQSRGGFSQAPRNESPRYEAPRPSPRNYEPPQSRGGYNRNYSQPRSEPQQLRINPPIVQNRGNSGGGGSRPSNVGGGGGARSNGGGGGSSRPNNGGGNSGGNGGGHGRH